MKISNSSRPIPRRRFLQYGGLAVAPMILPSRLFGDLSPSNTLHVGIVGAGSRSTAHVEMFSRIPGVRVVAVCDVWPKSAAQRKQSVDSLNGDSHCKTYHDYRDMIADPELDIVSVVVPDHWHALVATEAANRGKHVYLEKPFSYTVEEGRAIVEAVKRNGVKLQHGTQQRSNRYFQRATYLARHGFIGEVNKVYSTANIFKCQEGDPTPVSPPEGLDYDFFTGPAPVTPYVEGLAEWRPTAPAGWYFIRNFSGGWITTWGAHNIDSAQWILGKDNEAPRTIEAKGTFPEEGACETVWEWYSEFTYADRKKLIFASTNRPEIPGKLGYIVAVGDEGWVAATRNSITSNPPHLTQMVWPKDDPEFSLLQSESDLDHFENFIDAIRQGKRQNAPAEIGHLSTTLCHLANIGIEVQRPLHWDGQEERFVNDAHADRFLSRPMRAPWSLEV